MAGRVMRPVFLEGKALPVFPCRADKTPATPHGFKDASADPAEIAELWRRYWGPLVGVPTGKRSGLAVIDIDPRNGGDRAGSRDGQGYIQIGIDRVLYKAHRLAFVYMIGRWPAADVDHCNLIRDDNRWRNLREATRSQNKMNQRQIAKRSNLPRGVKKGRNGRFRARFQQTHLGIFESVEIASAVREEAARERFGEFYREP